MLNVPQGEGFPMAWWLSWFFVAFVVYALLGIWFWRSARRHDETVSRDASVRGRGEGDESQLPTLPLNS